MNLSSEIIIAVLVIRILFEIIALFYVDFRFASYFYRTRNNNILGDVILRWEHVSIIDKYHLREKWLGGSRLRIKRDPKRCEIRFYHLVLIPVLIFAGCTITYTDHFMMIVSLLFMMMMTKLIFDRLEKKRPLVTVLSSLFFIGIITGWVYLAINYSEEIEKASMVTVIPFAITVIVLIYSIIRKRIISVIVCGGVLTGTVLLYVLSGKSLLTNYLPLCICGYYYVVFVVIQFLYNKKALKKITFIQ